MQTKQNAKPFLKWAGGKKQVVNFIDEKVSQSIKGSVIDKYAEPFLGGGAVFFHLVSKYKINEVYLGDINEELILTYNVVKYAPNELISELGVYSNFSKLSQEDKKEVYYGTRKKFNENLDNFDYTISDNKPTEEQILRASQMIFLNKTCFNGLYRVNKSGKFNVPMGSYKNPLICDKVNILNVSKVLEDVDIVSEDYHASDDDGFIDENTFVYLDPPYLPIKENSFTSYTADGFGVEEQIDLSKFCKRIDEKDAKFILSNSDPKNHDPSNDFFEKTYKKLNLKNCGYKRIDVRRFINSKGNGRSAIKELLIFNF